MDLEALKQLPPWARELLSAVAVVLVVFLLAWGYTGNWPPMVVIESGSMEHDGNQLYPEPGFTHIGPIDTGDLVLVKSAERDDIVTYLEGKQTGYKRYGDYGDVIIYYKNGRSRRGRAPALKSQTRNRAGILHGPRGSQ